MANKTRDESTERVMRLVDLFDTGQATCLDSAAKALGLKTKTVTLRDDWRLAMAFLTRFNEDYVRDQALNDLTRFRRQMLADHLELHNSLKRAVQTPPPSVDPHGLETVQEPIEGFVNLDAMPAIVAVGKLINEDLSALQELYGVVYKDRPPEPFIGEKDGLVFTGGDQPIPLESAKNVVRLIENREARKASKARKEAGEETDEEEDDGPTPDDFE